MVNALIGGGIALALLLVLVAGFMYLLGDGDTAGERFKWWLQ